MLTITTVCSLLCALNGNTLEDLPIHKVRLSTVSRVSSIRVIMWVVAGSAL